MPKVAPTKYPVLKLAIGDSQYSQKEIAEQIGITQKAFCNKLQGKAPFALDEAFFIQENFFPNIAFKDLFAQKD